ncbi:TolC family protein [Spongiibacter sp.]|uniref:TolC family protein n=1 Tax=Spongiibacter sp. TaxID=2024860 RepID=UPI00356ACCA2
MSHRILRRIGAACICALILPAEASMAPWQERWLTALRQLPAVMAADAQRSADYSRSRAQRQAVYNPVLSADYEREGQQRNFSVGVSQTLDIWDQRKLRQQQAALQDQRAESRYFDALNTSLYQQLSKLLRQRSLQQQAALAGEYAQQLREMTKLLSQRRRQGDLGEIDWQLATQSLRSALADNSEVIVELGRVTAQLDEQLPNWQQLPELPDHFWATASLYSIDRHPQLVAAKLDWRIAEQQVALVRNSNRSEPTVGLSAGQAGDDDVVGLNLSLPLQVRRRYGDDVAAARQSALSVEAHYRDLRRDLQGKRNAAAAARQALLSQQTMPAETPRPAPPAAQLLYKQWRLGDVSTLDYLRSLALLNEGQQAQLKLQRQLQQAQLEELFYSAQLLSRLGVMSTTTTGSQQP